MENKQRIIQELVPGKQITLAHIIANPDPIMYGKLGLDPKVEYSKSAIGVLTVSPAETAIIVADIAMKSSGVKVVFPASLRPIKIIFRISYDTLSSCNRYNCVTQGVFYVL